MESPVVGVVFHIMGASMAAADGWFHNPASQVSAHFGIGQDGRLVQWVDTSDRAWHAGAANRHWIGVETEGSGGQLADAGVTTFGRLYAWLAAQYHLPFAPTDDPVNGAGLGWHGMGGDAWGGHPYCPGDARKNQRQRILDIAQGGGDDDVLTPEEHDALLDVRNKIGDLRQVALNEEAWYGPAMDTLKAIASKLDQVIANTTPR
jgi:hypothetical protein